MKIAIGLIKVDNEMRIRKDIGDLQPLIDSISKVGLINPILIDERSNLVAGFRRLEACKRLNMEEVEVRIVEFSGDMLKMLDVEVAENFFRKDFTPTEILATEKRRQEIIESTRKKGFFERFWLWLKRLFAPTAGAEKKNAPTSRPAAERQDSQRQSEENKAPEAGEENPRAADNTGEDDPRIIKWRSS